MNTSSNNRHWARQVWVVVVFILTVPTAVMAQIEPPPVVRTVFEFEKNSQFDENLKLEDKAQVAEKIGQVLADLARKHFSFLVWEPATSDEVLPPGSHVFRIVLRDEPKRFGTENLLKWVGSVGGQPIDLASLSDLLLYGVFDLEKHNPDKLREDIDEKLRQFFHVQENRKVIHDAFLQMIPLSREIIIHDSDQRIIVPLRWDTLHADPDSVLLVEFTTKELQKDEKAGRMKLTSVKKRLGAPRPGSVEGIIQMFDYAPIALTQSGQWDQRIPAVFDFVIIQRVFMKSYVQKLNADTADGLATAPEFD